MNRDAVVSARFKDLLYYRYINDWEYDDIATTTYSRLLYIPIDELERDLIGYPKFFDEKLKTLRFYVKMGNNVYRQAMTCKLSDVYIEELRNLLHSKENAFKPKKQLAEKSIKEPKCERIKHQKKQQSEIVQEVQHTPQYIDGVEIPPPPEGLVIMPDNKDDNIFTKSVSEIFRGLFN